MDGRARMNHLEEVLLKLYRRRDLTEDQQSAVLAAITEVAWDDAIHIAAPWEERSSLCGRWHRNLVSLDAPRPDSVSGCWACIMAAEWLSGHVA